MRQSSVFYGDVWMKRTEGEEAAERGSFRWSWWWCRPAGVRPAEREEEAARVGGREAAGTDRRRQGGKHHERRRRHEADRAWQRRTHVRRHVR